VGPRDSGGSRGSAGCSGGPPGLPHLRACTTTQAPAWWPALQQLVLSEGSRGALHRARPLLPPGMVVLFFTVCVTRLAYCTCLNVPSACYCWGTTNEVAEGALCPGRAHSVWRDCRMS
jgi:hypothetical protein